jgi:hypothetical protein
MVQGSRVNLMIDSRYNSPYNNKFGYHGHISDICKVLSDERHWYFPRYVDGLE